jgi:HK97 family phage major capsid protein
MDSLGIAAVERAQANLRVAIANDNRPDRRTQQLARAALEGLPAALAQLSVGKRAAGAAAEYSQEMQRIAPLSTANGIRVPWVNERALVSSIAGTGGYLVETVNYDPQPALVPVSAAAALGATIIETSTPFNVPVVRTPASTYLLTSETTQLTPAGQTFGQLAFSPHQLGAYTEISRLLLQQSAAQAVVARDIMAAIGAKLDALCLTGDGTNGAPIGVANFPGIGSFSGTALQLSPLLALQVAAGDALDETAGFATTLGVAAILRSKNEIAGSSITLWRGPLKAGTLVDLPARTTTGLTAGSLLYGSWQKLWIVIWSGGIELAVNPYAGFQSGIIGVRAMVTFDSGVLWPAAFAASSSAVS